MIILNLVKDRNTKGYEITMNHFWSECKRFNIELPVKKPPRKSAFCQARKKLKSNVIEKMLMQSVNEFENLYRSKYLWKGFRVFAVDGTKYTLPASEELIEVFGRQNCGAVEAHYPQTLVSILFNVKSKVAHDITIERNYSSERQDFKTLCNSLNDNDLLILDRGYPSYEIFDFLLDKKAHFIIRSPLSKTFNIVKDFLKSGLKDKIMELRIPDKNKTLKLRLIKAILPNGEARVFFTSLLDKNRYSYQEIVDLYYERWEIEEHYKKNKELFKVENFHSKTTDGILQEIYAQLLLSNLTRIMINEAEKDNENPKNEPGFKNAVYAVERYLNEIILCQDFKKIGNLFLDMREEIRRVRYKKRIGRQYPRRSFKALSKWTRKMA